MSQPLGDQPGALPLVASVEDVHVLAGFRGRGCWRARSGPVIQSNDEGGEVDFVRDEPPKMRGLSIRGLPTPPQSAGHRMPTRGVYRSASEARCCRILSV